MRRARGAAARAAAGMIVVAALVAMALAIGDDRSGDGRRSTVDPATNDRGARIALPGAPPFARNVERRLLGALAAKGLGYTPRTTHFEPDGAPSYVNRLILEQSPYLLQHAHNPVNWYPWGDEAFERAAREGKPVLLSIGYSTCHWCHVMEHESFEDEEIAAYLNEHYVAVKVDRERRPDVDAVYMAAVQSLTGGGGWPMTVWLTPDRKPFYGGTYFPPRDGDRGVRTGFLTLLQRLAAFHREDPARVAESAAEITRTIQSAQASAPSALSRERVAALTDTAARAFATSFDREHGGFGRAPKFPRSVSLEFLLRHYHRTGHAAVLDMVTATLDAMARGGIYDHVGGGFHRYATDAGWLVPHFEKMLYDNALLTVAYLEGYQASGRAGFADVATSCATSSAR